MKVYATDIDDEALTVARRGEYHVDQLRRLTPELRGKYFSGEGDIRRVNRELRRMVIFSKSDAIHDAPISSIAVLMCRNMLIYFDGDTQLHVLKRFHYALQPNGVLFLGEAEPLLLHSDLFTHCTRNGVFLKKYSHRKNTRMAHSTCVLPSWQ